MIRFWQESCLDIVVEGGGCVYVCVCDVVCHTEMGAVIVELCDNKGRSAPHTICALPCFFYVMFFYVRVSPWHFSVRSGTIVKYRHNAVSSEVALLGYIPTNMHVCFVLLRASNGGHTRARLYRMLLRRVCPSASTWPCGFGERIRAP